MATDTVAWPSEFMELKKLDVLLKCGICYDYMNTCMMTSCSHNYCSLCIRKFMQYKTQCPTCFEETHEIGLRNNRPLDEIILIYTQIKDRLLRTLRLAAVTLSGSSREIKFSQETELIMTATSTPKNHLQKTPFLSPGVNNEMTPPGKGKTEKGGVSCQLFPTLIRTPKSCNEATSSNSAEEVKVSTVKVPEMFHSPKTVNVVQPKQTKPKEMALCPVCQVEIPAKNINVHLDACLARSAPEAKPVPKPKPKRDPLPKRLYNLMADKDLKKTLKEYGLNTQGDRKTLISRLQRFTVLYNAENDAMNPRPSSEIIMQVERELREEKKSYSFFKAFHAKMSVDRKAPEEVIEKTNKEYLKENKDSFEKLIENMRAREGRNIRPLKPSARVESDEEWEGPSTSKHLDRNRGSGDQCKQSVGQNQELDTISVYSQETLPDEDSDVFANEPQPKTDKAQGRIDWRRTVESEEESKEDEVQKSKTPVSGKKKFMKQKKKDEENTSLSVLDQEDSEAYTSIFEDGVTPLETSGTPLEEADRPLETSQTPLEELPDFPSEELSSDSSFFETVNKSVIFGGGPSTKKGSRRLSTSARKRKPSEDEDYIPQDDERSSSPVMFDEETPKTENGPYTNGIAEGADSEGCSSQTKDPQITDVEENGRRRSKRKIVSKENAQTVHEEEAVQTRTRRKRAKTTSNNT